MNNEYKIIGEHTIIYCKYGESIAEVLIDTSNLSRVQKECTQVKISRAKGKMVKDYPQVYVKDLKKNMNLSRFIMNTPKGLVADHINGDTLNNTETNLRNITQKENVAHIDNLPKDRPIQRPRCSEDNPVGVVYHKRDKVWIARIKVGGKRIDLGRSKDKNEAIQMRMSGEEKYWG